MEERTKVRARVSNVLFPKGTIGCNVQSGEYAIVAFDILETLDGNSPKTNQYGNVVFKGIVPELNLRDEYIIDATLDITNKLGGYNIVFMRTNHDFENVDDQKKFLSYILTPKQVQSLYEHLDEPFEAIESGDIEELIKAKGVGVIAAKKMIAKFKDSKDFSYIYVELSDYGLTNAMIAKLMERYISPEIVVDKIKENPYVLADEVDGIGFKKADGLALANGMGTYDYRRIYAYIEHYLYQRAESGFSYVSPVELTKGIKETISADIMDKGVNAFSDAMNKLFNDGKIIWNKERTMISLNRYYDLEQDIANELLRILSADSKLGNKIDFEKVREIEKSQGWEFTTQQMYAIEKSLNNNVCVITGFGGTGKSSSVTAMLESLKNVMFAQTALSGKAASRLQEVTGEDGSTIHRLLGFDPINGFAHNENNQLPHDVIILDETSMVGGHIFHKLLKAIPSGAKLIMLGDDGQLESIGSLNLFKDIMDSGIVPTVKLTEIHRQAKKSAIITESIKIRNGQQLIPKGWTGTETRGELQDLKLNIYKDKERTADFIISTYKDKIREGNSPKDIMVVVPMKERGDASATPINKRIQSFINPRANKNYITIGDVKRGENSWYEVREDDRIIIRKNNYKIVNLSGKVTPVFNGNTGTVKEINIKGGYMILSMDEQGDVIYERHNWNKQSLQLGYTLTCHSAQGSESKIAIVGLDYSSFKLLSREWVYTAITRAKEECYLIAQNTALEYAIRTSNIPNKKTYLKGMLNKEDYKMEMLKGEDEDA